MDRSRGVPAALAVALGVVAAASLFTVDAREVAVVTAFGAPVRSIVRPGLYVRAPWPLQQVVRFDARAAVQAVKASELLTKDKKNLVVEAFAVWRVEDPQRFLEAVGRAEAAEAQISDMVVSQVAASFGQRELSDLLSVERKEADLLPAAVRAGIAEQAGARLGVEVLDVRIRQIGLPLQNEQSIYERMRAERLRIANAYRSEGEEVAAAIRAKADREAAEILAKADQEAAAIEAAAAREAAARYAEVYREDPAFFRWLTTLDAYEDALPEGSVLVVDGDSEFLQGLTRSPK